MTDIRTTSSVPLLFFHVGMGKVASTYLRTDFFPHLRGIRYLPRRQKHRVLEIMARGGHTRYLLCRALDTQMDEVVTPIARAHAHTCPIIVFRHPVSWIKSQYRRFVKNGFPGSLREFIDVADDLGFWGRDELHFTRKIRLLEDRFGRPPLVLFYEDLLDNPRCFFDAIARYTGTTYRFEDIPLARRHTSHDDMGLVLRRALRRRFRPGMVRMEGRGPVWWLRRRTLMLWAYLVIYFHAWLPARWLPAETLYEDAYLDQIAQWCATDWEAVKRYAREHPVETLIPFMAAPS